MEEVTLNTQQGLELINVINKLGLKEQLKEIALGTGETGKKQRAYAVKEQQYKQNVLNLIENVMTKEKFDSLKEEEQVKVLENVITEDVQAMKKELDKMASEINITAENEGFDLFYTAVIERLYGNQDVIFNALSSIYNVKTKDLKKQSFVETGLMIKKVITCNDIKNIMNVFL